MDESKDDNADTSVEEKAAPILVDEVTEAIRRLPCGKAAGYDDLPPELIKLDSDVIERVFCRLYNLIVDTGDWPDDWRRSVFVTIPKGKEAVRCEDHRTIALISHESKILLRILLNKMNFAAEEQIADVQMGFRQATPLRAMLFCPVQFSRTQPLIVRSSL